MAGGAALQLQRAVFEHEGPLFVGMTFDARGIGPDREPRLFQFKPAVRVVAVAAVHCAFHDLVAEGLVELGLHFRMAGHAKPGFARSEHRFMSLARLLRRGIVHEGRRIHPELPELGTVGTVALCTADVVAPVLAAAEIVVGFLAGVAR